MADFDVLTGMGKALALLRERAGFSTQREAAEALRVDQGQMSRWENDNPRPSLENLEKLLGGYGATAADLALALGAKPRVMAAGWPEEPRVEPAVEKDREEDQGPTDEELIRSLVQALRRVEGWQEEAEGRFERLEQLERQLGAGGPSLARRKK
jgi:transcriptional regulator with XRE-family HTH domain